MKKIRILAIVDLVLIALAFIAMIVFLLLSINAGFFAAGAALIALIIIGFLLKSARKKIEDAEKAQEEEDAPEESMREKAEVRSDL